MVVAILHIHFSTAGNFELTCCAAALEVAAMEVVVLHRAGANAPTVCSANVITKQQNVHAGRCYVYCCLLRAIMNWHC
jgi:hypothetical protein